MWLGNDVLIVGHGVTPSSRRGQPVLLSNGMYLNVELTLRAYRRPVPHLETVRATYSYQAGNKPDDRRPFSRTSSIARPHVHIHAAISTYMRRRRATRRTAHSTASTSQPAASPSNRSSGTSSTNTPSNPAAPTGTRSSGATKPTSATPNETQTGRMTSRLTCRPIDKAQRAVPTTETRPECLPAEYAHEEPMREEVRQAPDREMRSCFGLSRRRVPPHPSEPTRAIPWRPSVPLPDLHCLLPWSNSTN